MSAAASTFRAQRQLCLAQHLTICEPWAIEESGESYEPCIPDSSHTVPFVGIRDSPVLALSLVFLIQ